jgi:hypothetical protein
VHEVGDVGMASYQLQTKMIGLFVSQKAVVSYRLTAVLLCDYRPTIRSHFETYIAQNSWRMGYLINGVPPVEPSAAKLLSKDEVRRIAGNSAKISCSLTSTAHQVRWYMAK